MIGLAMIVRNGASTMVEAIEPFLQVTDEISIVLGGDSDDATPEIAQEYATVLSNYQGHSELPFHFGDCRQQSFDQMIADWVVVVDADDIWQGVEHLPSLIDEMIERDAIAAYVLYRLDGAEFYQPRIYRNGSGRWRGAIHEIYEMPEGSIGIKATKYLNVTQKPDSHRKNRNVQNIEIGEWALEQDPNDTRVISHLIKDYRVRGNFDRVYELCGHYLERFSDNSNEHFDVLHAKAEAELLQENFESAMATALSMLNIKSNAVAWVVFAEACQKAANGSGALSRLAVFASEQALFGGRSVDTQAQRNDLRGSIPCLIKAMALHELGDDSGAMKMTDLGLLIEPDNDHLLEVHQKLERLNTNGS